jgi:phosphate transport system substrate-binding protein
VVPVVHVADVSPGAMRFTGPLLADIYPGAVKRWNDPAIAAVNPGLSLPDQAITVVHRSDGSGTTFNFVNYLAKVSPAWKAEVGEGTSVAWPTGIGGKGNEGVAAYVRQVDGAIGYVELAYALQNGMAHAALRNAAGKFVQPNLASFQAAAASADWAGAEDFHLVITDAPGEASWPITASVFILVHRQPKDAAATALALDFFRWVWRNGADQAEALDYVPLPPALVERIEAYLARRIAS